MSDFNLYHITRKANQDNAPLIILLHGYGSNEQDLFSFAGELPADCFIVSVRAPYDLQPYGYAWYNINFDMNNEKFSDDHQAEQSIQTICTFIQQCKDNYPIDRDNINLIGFSQGAILSMAVALRNPGLVNNVAALSGYFNPDFVPVNAEIAKSFEKIEEAKRTKFFASHGTMDQVIPYSWSKRTPDVLDEIGLDNVFHDYPTGHGVAPENFRDLQNWLKENL